MGELRVRLVRSAMAVALSTALCAYFVPYIFAFLLRPIVAYLPPPQNLVVLSPLEPVVAYVKVAVMSGVLLAMPFILFQLWRFISPGLYAHERRMILPFVVLGTLFFFGGAAFGFFVFLPATFKFLVGVVPAHVEAHYSLERYFSLITPLLLACGAIFEMPLILAILALAGVVDVKGLRQKRKYAIIGAFVVSAILTPTVDPYMQTLMALPMIVFYEIGILFAWLLQRRAPTAAPLV